MKYISITLISLLFSASSCCNMKTSGESKCHAKKGTAYLIEGTWEANYILNNPKTFDELYPDTTPTITFTIKDSIVSGSSGCNNFSGKFTIDGNKISLAGPFAATRKMCQDMAGETLFMETLNKVSSYSVSNQGKTLNLIMGDIAVMRLAKK